MPGKLDRASETGAHQDWAEFYDQKAKANYPEWPNEVMLKIVFGAYLKQPLSFDPNWVVLDVGCGFANNLLPFLAKGCPCFGVEVDPSILDVARCALKKRGYEAQLRVGDNRSIPFDDNAFDLLLSINVLHYENSEQKVLEALNEYKRMLKPGGAIYLSTVGPEHIVRRRARAVGSRLYEIQNFDFRDGTRQFHFDDEEDLNSFLSQTFSNVETGRVTEQLMQRPLDYLVAVVR